MAKTIMFIHGAFMTPLCWEHMQAFFSDKGYNCVAPAWPYHDRAIEELRRNPDPKLAQLGIAEIVDAHAKQIRAMSEPPILIGHSFGGLFVQMLLDQGLGAAGATIDPAPPKGVLAFTPSSIKANSAVLLKWRGWRRIVMLTAKQFQYAFVNTLTPAQQQQVYDRYVVPESGRPFFQAAFSMLAPSSPAKVNFKNPKRAPLLIIAGGSDHIVPASVNRTNYQKYKGTPAITDFKEFAGRDHWTLAAPGWEAVATHIADWLTQRAG